MPYEKIDRFTLGFLVLVKVPPSVMVRQMGRSLNPFDHLIRSFSQVAFPAFKDPTISLGGARPPPISLIMSLTKKFYSIGPADVLLQAPCVIYSRREFWKNFIVIIVIFAVFSRK